MVNFGGRFCLFFLSRQPGLDVIGGSKGTAHVKKNTFEIYSHANDARVLQKFKEALSSAMINITEANFYPVWLNFQFVAAANTID